VTSARFWFESLQNWQSEFLSIAAMVWLAVYLRYRGSRNPNLYMRPTLKRAGKEHHMATEGTLHDAFLHELKDVYDAERQLTRALPNMAKAASSDELRGAFESHLRETEGQVSRLEQVFEVVDEAVKGRHCEGMAGIIGEGKAIMEEDLDEASMDAALIAAAQRVEHYEMAAYGTLIAWARAMGHNEVVTLLEETLQEEKSADKKLSSIAEGGINQTAADAAHGNEEDEEEMQTTAPSRGNRNRNSNSRRSASRR
jgi:ferritin-like metal-binding protein YciE